MTEGDHIGRYQIVSELGRGAMGVVYKAKDTAIGRVVAIKSIRLSDLTDESERQRLRDRLFREAQSAGILSHPNIVTIYDFSEENGLAYIFMECVNGPTFDKLLEASEMPAKETLLSLLRQTAGALDYAHRKGIVHRDIKPANIMIHDGAMAKVTDFGVARIVSHQMTHAGTMMGTPNYMSPEQVEGQNVDGRADQFSLAVVAWEIFAGERPFASDYLPTLLYKIVREDPPPLDRANPTAGPQVEAVLRKALSKNPAERYDECTQFVDALIRACGNSPGWTPITRGSAQSMPTVMEAAAARPPAPFGSPTVPVSAARAGRGNPLIRGLVWALVGIGIVGLAIISAQRFLMNAPVAATVAQTTTPLPTAGSAQAPTQIAKPSPAGDPAGAPVPEPARPKTSALHTAVAVAANPPPAQDIAPPPPAPRTETPTPARVAVTRNTGPATVQIVTEPVGAHVVIDGNPALACTSPCMQPLPPGRHTLRAEAAGYRTGLRIFNTPADTDIFIGLEKPVGKVSVISSPSGAAITVNGLEQTRTTPAVLSLAPGEYHIVVARAGRRAEAEVMVNEGEFRTLNLPLQ